MLYSPHVYYYTKNNYKNKVFKSKFNYVIIIMVSVMSKSGKLTVILYLYLMLVTSFFLVISLTKLDRTMEIDSIKLLSYDKEKQTIKILVSKKKNLVNDSFDCIAYYDNNIIKSKGKSNECKLTIPTNKNYLLYISKKGSKSKDYLISDYLNNVLSFNFMDNIIYLRVGEEHQIKYTDVLIDQKKENYGFNINDSSIASLSGDKITGLKAGTAYLRTSKSEEKLTIVVTDLISQAELKDTKKEILSCNKYTEEEAALLDKILAYKVNAAGYKTRSGALAAARFLTLEFNYIVPYFYENGRLHESGVHYTDGEGRYYHEGLYLANSKMDNIKDVYKGPAIWGCPLTNLEDDPYYGYIIGQKKPNGLDCSGFVAWVLKNGGFDPGDVGAGESEYPYQMTDLGDYTYLDEDLINSGKVKAGDLINFYGHIAIIIGIDDDNYYVAESLQNLKGAIARKYPKATVAKTFDHVVLMDKFYQAEGNYTSMWN